MNRPKENPTSRWVLAAAAAAAAFAAYWPQLNYPFVYDDESLIPNSEVICGGLWLDCLTEPWWPPHLSIDPLYRPVTTLSLRLNYALVGLEPFGYRLTNAVLHGLCAALVGLLGMRLWNHALAGWAAGLIFAVHPIHAEAVCLVVGRAELLAGFFSILLLYLHLGFLTGDRQPRLGHHLACALLLALAAGSKEHGLLAGIGVLLMDLCVRRCRAGQPSPRDIVNKSAASHYLGLVFVASTFLLVRWLLFSGRTTLPPDLTDPFANPLVHADWPVWAATPPALLALSLRLLVLPLTLSPIWSVGGFDLPVAFVRWDVIAGCIAAAAIILWTVIGLHRRQRSALLVALGGLFLILPCHFLPAANWLFAERWLYLPSVFVAVLLGRAVRNRWGVLILSAGIGVFAVANWNYQSCWRNTDVLMRETVVRQPHNYHGLLGHLWGLNDKNELASGQAEVHRLIKRFPDAPRAWYYQALLMDALGRRAKVLEATDRYMDLAKPTPMSEQLRRAAEKAKRSEDN